MKTLKSLLILLIGLLGCSKSTPDPAFSGDTSAVLNEQAWGGFSTTWRNGITSDPSGVNTVNLIIQNKLPYPKARLQSPTLCAGYCGDQSLTFIGVPLAVGVYTVSTQQSCSASTNQVGVSFMTLIGGDVIRDQYKPDLTRNGTIRITRYDLQRGEIEGTFEVSLLRDNSSQSTSDAAERVNFKNGLFQAKLP
ncbi:hypothetical protein [Spirosoma validum]|uniref:Lipoprotein n=1 Tax=Spirosoma validum TaxID=2771355 RepID=A0A927GFV6_9BACT|nr:hypothetical protein [Spirosoma validum]MBD2756053.1 hypothetical protein [Spirosoma validum]